MDIDWIKEISQSSFPKVKEKTENGFTLFHTNDPVKIDKGNASNSKVIDLMNYDYNIHNNLVGNIIRNYI